MKTKRKGTRNERRSMALLEAAGYRCIRAAGSFGEWDIVAIGPTDIVLVQVKSTDWPGTDERAILAEYRVPPNCRKLIHRWKHRARQPDVVEV